MPTNREKYSALYEFLDSATEEEKAEFFKEYALHLQELFGVSTRLRIASDTEENTNKVE